MNSFSKHSTSLRPNVERFAVHCALLLVMMLFAAQPAAAQSTKHPKPKITRIPNPKVHKNTDTVGIVNGDVITYYDFRGVMAGYLKSFAKRAQDNIITDSMFTLMVDSTWDQMVGDIITQQEIAKRHLAMSHDEAVNDLINNPPDFIRQQFTDSTGTLHPEYIRQALTDPRNDSITQIIIAGERMRMEQDRLMAVLAPQAKTAETRRKAYDAWLKRQFNTARIEDRRIAFGFY